MRVVVTSEGRGKDGIKGHTGDFKSNNTVLFLKLGGGTTRVMTVIFMPHYFL